MDNNNTGFDFAPPSTPLSLTKTINHNDSRCSGFDSAQPDMDAQPDKPSGHSERSRRVVTASKHGYSVVIGPFNWGTYYYKPQSNNRRQFET